MTKHLIWDIYSVHCRENALIRYASTSVAHLDLHLGAPRSLRQTGWVHSAEMLSFGLWLDGHCGAGRMFLFAVSVAQMWAAAPIWRCMCSIAVCSACVRVSPSVLLRQITQQSPCQFENTFCILFQPSNQAVFHEKKQIRGEFFLDFALWSIIRRQQNNQHVQIKSKISQLLLWLLILSARLIEWLSQTLVEEMRRWCCPRSCF